MKILLVESIFKFMFPQLPLVLSVLEFIINVPVPLLQNDPAGLPNCKSLLVDPTVYLLFESVFGYSGRTLIKFALLL